MISFLHKIRQHYSSLQGALATPIQVECRLKVNHECHNFNPGRLPQPYLISIYRYNTILSLEKTLHHRGNGDHKGIISIFFTLCALCSLWLKLCHLKISRENQQ